MAEKTGDAGTVEGPAFDPKKAFGTVYGVAGVKFVQGKYFYGRNHELIGEAPKAHQMDVPPEQVSRATARANALKSAKKQIGRVPNVPTAVVKAETENARAKRAEEEFGG